MRSNVSTDHCRDAALPGSIALDRKWSAVGAGSRRAEAGEDPSTPFCSGPLF